MSGSGGHLRLGRRLASGAWREEKCVEGREVFVGLQLFSYIQAFYLFLLFNTAHELK
jgi:hypothetical protein